MGAELKDGGKSLMLYLIMKNKPAGRISYEEHRVKCREFLNHYDQFSSRGHYEDDVMRRKYMAILQRIADEEARSLEIQWEDLQSFFGKEQDKIFLDCILSNTRRYIEMFSREAEEIMPKRSKPINLDDEIKLKLENVLRDQRKDNFDLQNPSLLQPNEIIPSSINKNFDVAIVYGENSKEYNQPKCISQLDARQIGSLVIVKAIVVRAGPILPEISVATYACDVCGCENYQEVFDNNYRPLDKCMSKKCVENKVSGKLSFLPGHSKFKSYQELKVQETPDQLKEGRIPRSFTIILKDSNVKKAVPGDMVLVQGILLPQRKLGFRHQHDIAFDCHLETLKVTRQKKKYFEVAEGLNEDEVSKIDSIRASMGEEELFNKMADSIAPEIFGMKQVKKALLLMMVGGVSRETADHMKIRGEINIALVGDPGIAKSQLLKHISYLAPRAVYTTGKGSSGVGLTAAIVTEGNGKDLALEAGALVLADMGVCCIDEFDKMDEYDRTAIHQVMEQQTVSIAKAGITTTLNARTSILAAANPLYGRYNHRESLHKNINLPPALLSRFDLIFVLLDQADSQRDRQLARHIGTVHMQLRTHHQASLFSQNFLRTYIALAKSFTPTISQSLHSVLIQKYIQKRQEQQSAENEGEKYTTTRSLLALIRLCQARARLRFSSEVSKQDIQQCLQLLEESQKNLGMEKEGSRKPMHDYMSKIFEILKDQCNYSEARSVDLDMLRKRVLARGYTENELGETLDDYLHNNVIMQHGSSIILLNS